MTRNGPGSGTSRIASFRRMPPTAFVPPPLVGLSRSSACTRVAIKHATLPRCATRGRRSARRCRVAERCTASGVVRQRRFRWVVGKENLAGAAVWTPASSDRADDYSPGSLIATARTLRPFASTGAPRSPARRRGRATLSYARRQRLAEAFRRGRRQVSAMSPRSPARRPRPPSRPLLWEQSRQRTGPNRVVQTMGAAADR